MLWDEYLLVCLGEEFNESAQEVAKCLRFTCMDRHPSKPHNNLEGLRKEFSQVIAVMELLEDEGIHIMPVDRNEIEAKKQRLLEYAEHSRKLGVLK
jgi:hypothetical protein